MSDYEETPLDFGPRHLGGCLPRKTKFGQCCLPLADSIEIIPRSQWNDLIGTVDLRPKVNQVLDQDGVGSCATESTTQALMIAREVAGHPFELLNPWSIYRVTSGGSDNGSSIDENLEYAREYGVLPESYWPRSKGWRAVPPTGWKDVAAQYRIDEFFDIRNTEEVGTALLLGFPVVFGWDGHSCVMTSLKSSTVAGYANSWGDWGDEGFGTVKLSSINFSYGAFAVRTATSDGGLVVPDYAEALT
jgi:hypothetical protein